MRKKRENEVVVSRLRARIKELETICRESYQVVGTLSYQAGVFEKVQTQHVLDNLSRCKLVHKTVLPYTMSVTRLIRRPNETTRQAIEELEEGRSVKTHSVEDCLKELDMSN